MKLLLNFIFRENKLYTETLTIMSVVLARTSRIPIRAFTLTLGYAKCKL